MTTRRYHTTDEYVASVARMIRAAGRRVGTADPDQLAALARLRRTLDEALADAVAGQRAAGIQWQSMGDALGVTKQAVIQRWAPLINDRAATDGIVETAS